MALRGPVFAAEANCLFLYFIYHHIVFQAKVFSLTHKGLFPIVNPSQNFLDVYILRKIKKRMGYEKIMF